MFPRMGETDFAALRDDIKANGLLNPITLHDGMILDGGNRYRACLEAGVEPRFEDFDGDSIVSFVLSSNFHRRHLSAGQQALIVAQAQDWEKAQAWGGDRKSDQVAKRPLDSPSTIEDRAVLSGASHRTQRRADKIAREAPDLAEKVVKGEMTLNKAFDTIAKPKQKEPTTERSPSTKPYPEGMFDKESPLSAFVSKARALDAISKINAHDPNALRCLDGIQKALDDRRVIIENIIRTNHGR